MTTGPISALWLLSFAERSDGCVSGYNWNSGRIVHRPMRFS
jgi:hypothetical protein